MRLCLVSAILALIVSIQFQSEQLWLLVLLIIAVSVCSKSCPWSVRLLAPLCVILSAYYSQLWLAERMEGRLDAELSGISVTGYGEVVGCSDASVDVEKILLRVGVLNTAEKALPPLKQLALNFYRRSNRSRSDKIGAIKNSFIENSDTPQLKDKIPCGASIKFTAKLRSPYGFVNPWGFDYEAWLLSRQIDATGYLLSYEIVGMAKDWRSQFVVLREQWIQRAAALKGPAGQLVPALLFGESGYLPNKHWLDFQLTGTIHLLVVSGLHVGFLIFMVTSLWYILVRLEVLILFPRASLLFKLTPLILLLACALYAYMAGMGLAIQRAGLMLAFGICVVYLRYHWSLLDTLLWVILLVLIVNPLSSLFVGFWFSFAAVSALLMSYLGQVGHAAASGDVHTRIKSPRQRVTEKLTLFYHPQWVVFLALMPLLWIFQQPQSALSFFINIVAIPLLGFVVMPLAMVAFIWPDGVAVDFLNVVLTHTMEFLHQISQFPSWLVYKPAGGWLLVLFPLVLLALWLPGAPYKRLSLFLLILIFLLPVSVNDKKLIVFDVGQGLAVYGSTNDSAYDSIGRSNNGSRIQSSWLYDTGAQFRSGFSLGDAVVAKNILAFKGKSLDLLFVSHSDNDHAGGEFGLRRKIKPALTYAGQPREGHHQNCHALKGWHPFGGGEDRWRVLAYKIDKASDNNQSCVVQIEMAGKTILLPGDIDKKAELLLLKLYGHELKSDVLIVGHHGSKSSSSEAWLAQVDPQLAIVSTGFKNRFNHPHSSIVQRFQQRSIPLFNTADSGAVEVTLAEVLSVTAWRKKNAPIWRQM
jgi:competence protein ComEC